MISAIVSALDKAYSENEMLIADILVWLKDNYDKEFSTVDKELLNQWFSEHGRCTNCGKKLLTTYKTDRTVSPPIKRAYQFCPDCYI